MTFASPELLLGLLLVPAAIGLYLLVQRRRSRYAVRFPLDGQAPEPTLLPGPKAFRATA